jgi:hypothetical protein
VKRAGLLLLFLVAACSPPSVAEVCKHIREEDCYDHFNPTDCLVDGNAIETAATDAGCHGAFDDYMWCLGDHVCYYANSCSSERAALEACVGTFP